MPQTPAPEPDVVVRARDGDQQAFAELFTAYWGAARGCAYAVLRDIARAEDAAAEAFRLALPGLRNLRDPARFGPWLRRIVRRVARKQREKVAQTAPLEDGHATVDHDRGVELERAQMALVVARGVEELPDAEREAIVLCYLEGYATEHAARFLGIPVGSLRRRLHDGRLRLKRIIAHLLDPGVRSAAQRSALQVRLERLLAHDVSGEERYGLGRELLMMRPVPAELLASLVHGASFSPARQRFAAHLLTRTRGPLLMDPGRAGAVARALRAALGDFADWSFDVRSALQAWSQTPQHVLAPDLTRTARAMPSPFAAGQPAGRYVSVSRGLLAGRREDAVTDLWEVVRRSESVSSLQSAARQLWLSDVLDVWWVASGALELSDVEAWVTALAQKVVPTGQTRFALHTGPRYRRALRLTFLGDRRPAAIGGVLASRVASPEAEGIDAVHVRLYVEPWAQAQTRERVPLEPVRLPPSSGRRPDGRPNRSR